MTGDLYRYGINLSHGKLSNGWARGKCGSVVPRHAACCILCMGALVLLGLVKLYRLPVQTVVAPMRSPVNGTCNKC